jgi:hypothetical protein
VKLSIRVRLTKRVRVDVRDRVRDRFRVKITCPWIVGHSCGLNNRSSSQTTEDAVEPWVRVFMTVKVREGIRVRVRG